MTQEDTYATYQLLGLLRIILRKGPVHVSRVIDVVEPGTKPRFSFLQFRLAIAYGGIEYGRDGRLSLPAQASTQR